MSNNLFDISKLETKTTSKKVVSAKKKYTVSDLKEYIGLNDIWKDFGNYIKNERGNTVK